MVSKELEEIVNLIKKTHPDFYQQCYPKPYHSGGQWPSPKYFAFVAFESFLQKALKFKEISDTKIDSVAISVYYTVARLLELEVPTYFVAPDLFQALSQSELPPTLHLNELKWPLDAMLFVLPKGILCSPSGETLYLAIALNQAGRRSSVLANDEYITTSFNAITTFAFTNSKFMYAWSHPVNEDLITNLKDDPIHDLFMCEEEGNIFSIKVKKLSDADIKFAKLHYRLTIQLMLSMIARPELIKKEEIVRHPNLKKDKRGLFTPNILGANYKTLREYHGGGTHESPIIHWRRGFFRHYVPGEGKPWRQQQIKWIEPVLVLGSNIN